MSTSAPTAHPVPSDAELVKFGYETARAMENPLYAIENYARTLLLIGCSDLVGSDLSGPLNQLGDDIRVVCDGLKAERKKLFHALHPRRGEPDFPPVDGDEEAEEDEP